MSNHTIPSDYTLDDYKEAPSGIGPLADTWADKPHRLVYDLVNIIKEQDASVPTDLYSCSGITGFIFGHKFEGRYSVEEEKHPSDINNFFSNFTGDAAIERAKRKDVYKKTYHGDVCIRCGLKINK